MERGIREKPPSRRKSEVVKVKLEVWSIFVCVGFYPDGRPAELFVDMPKTGSPLRALANSTARLASLSLQYGAPVEAVCSMLKGVSFLPQNSEYSSFIDAIGCVLEKVCKQPLGAKGT